MKQAGPLLSDSYVGRAQKMLLETEIIHDGFFHPREPPLAVDAHRFHHVLVAGLPLVVMFCRVRVTPSAGESIEHIVIYANHPRLSDELVIEVNRVLVQSYPALIVSFTRDVEAGRAR